MDKIFQIEPFDEFQKEIHKMLDYYYSKNDMKTPENSNQNNDGKYELMHLLIETSFEINQISKRLSVKDWHEEKILYFLKLITEQKTDLLYATLVHQNCEQYGETIIGFDWILKLVLGTSELNTLRCPLLQLIFTSTDISGTQKKIQYDLNKDILLKAIDVLEKLEDS